MNTVVWWLCHQAPPRPGFDSPSGSHPRWSSGLRIRRPMTVSSRKYRGRADGSLETQERQNCRPNIQEKHNCCPNVEGGEIAAWQYSLSRYGRTYCIEIQPEFLPRTSSRVAEEQIQQSCWRTDPAELLKNRYSRVAAVRHKQKMLKKS